MNDKENRSARRPLTRAGESSQAPRQEVNPSAGATGNAGNAGNAARPLWVAPCALRMAASRLFCPPGAASSPRPQEAVIQGALYASFAPIHLGAASSDTIDKRSQAVLGVFLVGGVHES
jgi:hypothetical protein